MSQSILGLDIGSYSLKFVLIRRTVRQFELLNYVEHVFDSTSRLPHEEQVKTEIRKIMAEHDLQADVVSVSLSSHLFSSRLIEMPLMQSSKMAQAIEFELENYLPFAMEDIVFDHAILSQTDTMSRVLCCYLLDKKFSAYMGALTGSGIDPKYVGAGYIDLGSLALAGLVPAQGCYAICDIGHSKTSVCVFEGRQMRYARTIGIGGFQFTRAIQRSFNLNHEKAEALKVARGRLFVREEESDQVSRLLGKVAIDLIASVKQTFLGYQDTYKTGISPQVVLTCGGGSRLPGMMEYMSYHLRTNVLDVDPLSFFSHHLENAEEKAPVMAGALATALRPVFSSDLPRINFRKGEYAYKKDADSLKMALSYLGVGLVLILLMGGLNYYYSHAYYTARRNALDKKIEKVLKENLGEAKIKGKGKSDYVKNALKKMNDELSKVQAASEGLNREKYIPIMRVLEEISNKLPPKKDLRMWIESVDYKDNFIIIQGVTEDYEKIGKIVESLQQSDLFKSVQSKNEQKTRKNELKFVLNIDLAGES